MPDYIIHAVWSSDETTCADEGAQLASLVYSAPLSTSDKLGKSPCERINGHQVDITSTKTHKPGPKPLPPADIHH